MRHFGNWLMALGLLAAAPTVTHANWWSRSSGDPQAARQKNQKVANELANALRDSKLQGYDIGIEVKEGTASLTGEVTDAGQKDKATQVAAKIRGVKKVDNRLLVTPPRSIAKKSPTAPAQRASEIQQVSAVEDASNDISENSGAPLDNQQMAEQIAETLGKIGLSRFDLEVRFQDGKATIAGAVANPEQRAKITQTISRISGVDEVNNQVTVMPKFIRQAGGPMPAGPMMFGPGMRGPIQQVAYQAEAGPLGPGPMGGGGMPMMAMPVPMAKGAAHQVYDMPNLPDHSWPTYSPYPNYASLTYPKEYSASAWPYIGPFYPYPQIPLGWRTASLEWDDGHWNLNFRSRTEKWWWFLSPQNW